MHKYLKALFLILVLFSFIGVANALQNNNFELKSVEINGDEINLDTPGALHIERGDVVDIEVRVAAREDDTSDVRIKASIDGYEYGDIDDRTDLFDIDRAGVTHLKTLSLTIPNDIDVDDGDYEIEISVGGKDTDDLELVIPLVIEGNRHSLHIYDVLFNPGLEVEAGKPLFAVARVENLGDKKEDDVKVIMSIPELGLSSATYIDELIPQGEESGDDDEESSESSDELYLKIPLNVKEGEYQLRVDVEYNRGHDVETALFNLMIKGAEKKVVDKEETEEEEEEKEEVEQEEFEGIISVDTLSQTVAQGEGIVYRVMFANLGKTKATYTVSATDISAWGNVRVDPGFVTVMPDSTGEMFIYVVANENAPLGNYQINTKVKADNKVVQEFTLTANVVKGKSTTTGTGVAWGDVKRGLEIGFIVLVILLIILGLIIAFRRVREEGYEEEPSAGASEGQTYYYYPRY